MTITVERPAVTGGAPAQTTGLRFVPCPDSLPWCFTHETDPDGAEYHHGAYTPIKTGGPASLVGAEQPKTIEVTAARLDTTDGQTLPVVWLLPDGFDSLFADAVGFTPEQARAFAAALLDAADSVTTVRGEVTR
ncbi:hypothetical protein GCM10009827_084060 [Dactylosporangium maewongense]|uniref:Uncharacterized protein n=1 Tax=Dactylosporangium maewongense TaxID=634393 RepID=A0ABN2C0Y8_9ACTN